MALFLRSNLIHCAVHDPATGEYWWPTRPGIKADTTSPYLYEVEVYSDVDPEPAQYHVWRTLFEYFNPFRSQYKPTTCNCVTYIANLLGLDTYGKRPSSVREELFCQSGLIARTRLTSSYA